MKIYADINDDNIEEIYIRISNNIKIIRENKKITQQDIALAMGFTTATFYTNAENLKQGKHFNLEHLIRISKYLDVDIKDLFEDI